MNQIRCIYNGLVDKRRLIIIQKFDSIPYDMEGQIYFDFIQNTEVKF